MIGVSGLSLDAGYLLEILAEKKRTVEGETVPVA